MTAKSASDNAQPNWFARLLPIIQWAPHYNRAWLRPDLIAGLTVAALVVPKSLGYAGIAGVPIQHGLYAAAAGAIIYALFGTCKQVATGPSSALVAAGAELRLARVKASIRQMLKTDGFIDTLGEDHIYGNVYEAAADRIPDGPVPPAASQ